MKRSHIHTACGALVAATCGVAVADDPIVLVWSKIAGGGGTMTGGGFDLVATVGQGEVSGVLTDGDFTLYNGYWGPASGGGSRPCPGDFNHDGAVDFFDYDAFVASFEAGALDADVNWDHAIDFFDYDHYVELFEIGC